MHINDKLAGRRLEAMQSGAPTCQPKIAVAVFGDGVIAGKRLHVGSEPLETQQLWIEAVQPFIGSDPERSFPVDIQVGSILMAQAVVSGRVVLKYMDLATSRIETIQTSSKGSEPQVP